MHRRTTHRLLAATTCALGTAAFAQPEPVLPHPKPEPIKPTGPASEPAQPAGPQVKEDAIPGLDDSDFRVAAAPLRSEGTFLAELRGSLLRLPTGERVVVFYTDDQGRRERPMVLIPCTKLQQMEQLAADRQELATFVVSGQVFVYLQVNYFLPTAVRVVSTAVATEAPPSPDAASPPTTSDPGVQNLIRQLEAQREAPREHSATPAAPDVAKPDAAVLPEGQAIVRRRGRLVRATAGDWSLSFDNGTAGEPKSDSPVAIIPCLNLQRMEAWAMRTGDATSFEVSGRALVYQNRNYLIPTLFQVYPLSDLEARH